MRRLFFFLVYVVIRFLSEVPVVIDSSRNFLLVTPHTFVSCGTRFRGRTGKDRIEIDGCKAAMSRVRAEAKQSESVRVLRCAATT